jgi:hypothetical protein
MALAPLRLPRLAVNSPIAESTLNATVKFSSDWNKAMGAIEGALNDILAIPEIQTALDNLDGAVAAAQEAAAQATEAAGTAQGAADANEDSTALANSWPSGAVISATDTGTSVAITISGHQRIYPKSDGNTSVNVNGGAIAGQPYDTDIFIFYHQASRAGGAVTYVASANANDMAQVGDVHAIGSVHTPVAAAAPKTGNPTRPPGYAAPLQ